jgi:hypothetical protein
VTPNTAATYWIGAASDSTALPLAATVVAFRLESRGESAARFLFSLIDEAGTRPALIVGQLHGGSGATAAFSHSATSPS